MQFVVTGTPGAGTRYMWRVLNHLLPTGHEVAFNSGAPDGTRRIAKSYDRAEVSWYAAVFLHNFTFTTVHLVRHPLLNIRTLTTKTAFWQDHSSTIKRFTPRAFDYKDPERAARFWLDWNRLCEKADFRWNLHDLTADNMFPAFVEGQVPATRERLAAALETPPEHVGEYDSDLDWSDLGRFKAEVYERAVDYRLE